MSGKKTIRGTRLAVEGLESKELMAVNILAALKDLPALVFSPLQQSGSQHLSGIVTGRYKASTVVPDVGQTISLSGSGRLASLGRVQITGNLHSIGFVQSGHATGILAVSTPRGTLTLDLTGPSQAGFSSLPNEFQYKSGGGTGAFKDVNASGQVGFLSIATGRSHAGGGSGGLAMLAQGRFLLAFS